MMNYWMATRIFVPVFSIKISNNRAEIIINYPSSSSTIYCYELCCLFEKQGLQFTQMGLQLYRLK